MIDEATFSVGAAARLTGLSPDLLRAWERRYRVVEPVRSAGGTRRYRESDVEKLRLMKAVVDAGHRIGDVAGLSVDELRSRVSHDEVSFSDPVEATLRAVENLDALEAERLISTQLAALGAVRFAKQFALPLLVAIGDRWEARRLCVASEHLASALLRSLLGSALRPTAAHRHAPVVVFATLPGERHELGLLIAALTALGAGANPLYLGADLPASELSNAAVNAKAGAVALSVVVMSPDEAAEGIAELRESLPPELEIWAGGPGAEIAGGINGVVRIGTLDDLERRVEQLRLRSGAI